MHFIQSLDGLREILEGRRTVSNIKRSVGKRHRRRVPQSKIDVHARLTAILLGDFDQRPADVQTRNVEISQLRQFE